MLNNQSNMSARLKIFQNLFDLPELRHNATNHQAHAMKNNEIWITAYTPKSSLEGFGIKSDIILIQIKPGRIVNKKV